MTLTQERSIGGWIGLVRDGALALFVVVNVFLCIGIVVTALQPNEYSARGQLVISSSRGFLSPEGADAYPLLTDTVRRLVHTPSVLSATARSYVSAARDPATARQRRNLASVSWLRSHLRARQVSNLSIIELTGTAGTQSEARALTRAAVRSVAAIVNDPDSGRTSRSGLPSGLTIRVFSEAEPEGKASPTPVRNLLLAINAGLIIGVIAAGILGARRNLLRDPVQIARSVDLPLVGELDAVPGRNELTEQAVGALGAWVRAGELQNVEGPLLVTGAMSPQLIAEVSAHIAAALSAESSTVLVDADLDTRAASRLLAVTDSPGLAESLNGDRDGGAPTEFLVPMGSLKEQARSSSQLMVLPAGRARLDPTAALGGHGLVTSVEVLRARYKVVVLAAPNLNHLADVMYLLGAVDRALLFVPRGVPAARLKSVQSLSAGFKRKFIGAVVVNHVSKP